MAVKFTPENPLYSGDKLFANTSAEEIQRVLIDVPDMQPPGLDTSPFKPDLIKKKKIYQVEVCLWLYTDSTNAEMYLTPQQLTPGYPELSLPYKEVKQRGGLRVQLPHEGKHWYGRLTPTGNY